jgi:hypothetical protein
LAAYIAKVRVHGCNVGKGPAGIAFCRKLAQTLHSAVDAGLEIQWGTDVQDGTSSYDDEKLEGPFHRFDPTGRLEATLTDRRPFVGKWKFEIPDWQGTDAATRYANGWHGTLVFQGAVAIKGKREKYATSGSCYWVSTGKAHAGWWHVVCTMNADGSAKEWVQFGFTGDERLFTASVGAGSVCEGSYKNPGWPDGWFRITRQ